MTFQFRSAMDGYGYGYGWVRTEGPHHDLQKAMTRMAFAIFVMPRHSWGFFSPRRHGDLEVLFLDSCGYFGQPIFANTYIYIYISVCVWLFTYLDLRAHTLTRTYIRMYLHQVTSIRASSSNPVHWTERLTMSPPTSWWHLSVNWAVWPMRIHWCPMFAQSHPSHVAPKLFGHGWYPHYIPLDPKYPHHLPPTSAGSSAMSPAMAGSHVSPSPRRIPSASDPARSMPGTPGVSRCKRREAPGDGTDGENI